MSGGLTDLLARLLASDELRAAFRQAPQACAAKAGCSEQAAAELAALDPLALEAQAHALLAKRYAEVAKLLPATFAALGPAARVQFMQYARGHWPRGHRRHLLDALGFIESQARLRRLPAARREAERIRRRLK